MVFTDTMRMVFVGGDSRMLYAARRLRDMGAAVAFAAEDASLAKKRLASESFGDIDVIERSASALRGATVVLPLPASRDGVHICDPIIGESIVLGEFFALLSPGTRVFCGMARTPIADAARNSRAKLIDYYADEAFLLRNAALTAEGALAELIRLTPTSLLGSHAVIFGYGRCASALSRRLFALGASVSVIARSETRRASAIADGARSFSPENAERALVTASYAVNTVPYGVIGVREAAMLAEAGAFVLELADRPGVTEDAASLVRIERAAALPGRYSPKSAGELIAEAIASSLGK